MLEDQAIEFDHDYPNATIFSFSLHEILAMIIDTPKQYGLDGNHADIWEKHSHLTAKVQKIIASNLRTGLGLNNS